MVPLPPSHSFQVPVRAGRPVLLVIGPEVPVQLTAPDSKPGFASSCPVVPPPPVPVVQVGSPAWAGTLTAFQAALTALNSVQLVAPYRFLAAVSVQVRYFRYDDDEVFISIALYMILAAFWMPMPVTVEPLQVGLVGWPSVGLVPSASR